MEKSTTEISAFENLRKAGYVYVDKADLLWRLVAEAEGRPFLISRTRRFGKSLMLSALKAIFVGKRELFKGLKSEKTKHDEKGYAAPYKDKHPVMLVGINFRAVKQKIAAPVFECLTA